MPVLRFLNELFLTFWADDSDFSFSPGNTDRLMAPWAFKIPMLPILNAVQQHQKPAVFPVTLIGIMGKGPKNGDTHQHIRQQMQQQLG